ncbi:apical junction component 1 homolog [Penaeus japonicus]|uniref:apical junction component 1 homolog n=1 Tax=Penaeus japonicus TaxID=27405 RepID=UPI001C712969|nr:apical junction component 1 homolog [Penaeus japonicus]
MINGNTELTSVQLFTPSVPWFETSNISGEPESVPVGAKVSNFSVMGTCAPPEGVGPPYRAGGWIINQLGGAGDSQRQPLGLPEAGPLVALDWPGVVEHSALQGPRARGLEGWLVPHPLLPPPRAHVAPPVPPTVPLIPLPPRRGVTFHLPPRHMNIPPDSSSENGNENVSVDEEKEDDDEEEEEEEDEEEEEEEEEEEGEEEDGEANHTRGQRGVATPSGGAWQCQYPRCGKVVAASSEEPYKECHQCHTPYCSRPCRRMHWDNHKRHCARIRARALAKELSLSLRHQPKVLEHLSVVARRGLRSLGRGAVKIFFRDAEEVENFLLDVCSPAAPDARKDRETKKERAHSAFPQLHYVTSQDLLPQETGEGVYRKICQLCKLYNTRETFVLYVSICVVEGGGDGGRGGGGGGGRMGQGIGGGGTILSRVSRCVKLKLAPEDAGGGGGGGRRGGGGGGGSKGVIAYPQRFLSCPTTSSSSSSSSSNVPPILPPLAYQQNFISRDLEGEPETLILTPLREANRDPTLPPLSGEETPATRLATYHNILQRLGERGISLRHQYPEVERRLRAFVELGHPFPPVTIQPRNASTGSTFLCVIMPRLDASKLQLLTRRNSRVVTLDVSPSLPAKKTGSRR